MEKQFEAFETAMLIKEIYSTVMHHVSSSLQESGLTHQQIMIIKLVAHNKEINISELCEEMSLTKGTVSGIVRRLESAGYVQKLKHKEDKRNTYIVFSEKGKQFAYEFRDVINDSFKKAFSNFTQEDIIEAKRDLMKIKLKMRG